MKNFKNEKTEYRNGKTIISKKNDTDMKMAENELWIRDTNKSEKGIQTGYSPKENSLPENSLLFNDDPEIDDGR